MIFKEFLKIGHRGAMAYAVENSRESIKKAFELDANMVEVDIRYTRNNIPLVFHDEKTNRITNGQKIVGNTDFSELKTLKLKNGERILSLEELLHLIPKNAFLNIELKEKKISKTFIEVLSKFDTKKILFSSFYHEPVLKLKDFFREIKSGVLLVGRPLNILELAKETKADYLDLNYEFVDKELIDAAHLEGIGVVVWKINELELMQKFIDLEVDGIISDNPALFNKIPIIKLMTPIVKNC